MSSSNQRVAVLGAGSWGTALAQHLARSGQQVSLWGRSPEILEGIRRNRKNPHYLKTVELHPDITPELDLDQALDGARTVVIAVPADGVRALAKEVKEHATQQLVISTSKGLESGTLKRMSEVLNEELSGTCCLVAALSGPTFAIELAQGLPTAAVAAAADTQLAEASATLLHFDNFRVYTSQDVIGVELGGVVKNIIAIAAGLVDGLEAGSNARAALITRGLSEMQRLVVARGGDSFTMAGLSGLGDLLLTATGDLSRNRQVGMRLAKGEQLQDILTNLGQVAEGVRSTEHVLELARDAKISVPISEEVGRILRGERTPRESVNALLARTRGSEVARA